MSGWIYLHRKLLDNPFWTCETFTRGQAWVDLLFLANYSDSFFYVRGNKVNVKTGQVAWSEPKLAERWGWSRTKLRKFLNDLEKEQQIIQQKNTITQIITINNYSEYQKKEQQKDSRKTAEEQQKDVSNKGIIKDNKGKRNSKVFVPPQLEDVIKYFNENGYSKESAIKSFNYYDISNWVDSRGNKIRNWKQKMNGVWFKPENRNQLKSTTVQ